MVNTSQVETLLKKYFKISGQISIQPDLVVDVHGDVQLKYKINQLPVQFGHVEGDFICSNSELTSLEGAPQHVDGDFICQDNKLTSLRGAPHHVGGHFYCDNNLLINLQGAPEHVEDHFSCISNMLTGLTGAPVHVGDGFYCNDNKLTSLQGAPANVGGDFVCSYDVHMPLLRLIMYDRVYIVDAPEQVEIIMLKYKGTGRAGALKAAAELIRAGYKENARW